MKFYRINLNSHDASIVSCILADDLDILDLDSYVRSAYESILDGANSNGYKFYLDDDLAHIIIQMLTVYAERLIEAGDTDRAGALLLFTIKMLAPYTGKNANDY